MPSPKILFVLFCLFLVGLVYSAPARLLLAPLNLDQQGVYLQGVNGKWFNGGSDVFQVSTPQYDVQLQNLKWDIQFSRLLEGQLGVDIAAEFAGRPITADVAVAPDGTVTVSNLKGTVSFSDIAPLVSADVPIQGMAHTEKLSFTLKQGWPHDIDGVVAINNVTVVSPIITLVLGNMTLQLSDIEAAQPATVLAEIIEYQGQYGLQGQFELDQSSHYQLVLSSKPDDTLDPLIAGQMQMFFGAPMNGRFSFEYDGRL